MKKDALIFMGVGDLIIDREKPETIFRDVAKTLDSADIAFANSDELFGKEGYPIHGHGTPADPKILPAVQAHFDVISLANNHSYDWGKETLLDTFKNMKKAGLPYVGAGKDIQEAHKPVILEAKGTKVGFLAYSSVHRKGYEAGPDKPGVAQVRVWTIYDQDDFQPGTPPRIVTFAYKEDLEAMVEDIKQLKSKVDIVVISFHWGLHIAPQIIPMYCKEVGHAAIDAGADLILGTHPHIGKGIEMYKGKAIFYSTGNFAAELGIAQRANGSDKNALTIFAKYGAKADPEVPNLVGVHDTRYTLIVKARINDGQIKKVSYIPCYVDKNCEPEIVTKDSVRGQETFKFFQDNSMAENLPVNFGWEGNEIAILP